MSNNTQSVLDRVWARILAPEGAPVDRSIARNPGKTSMNDLVQTTEQKAVVLNRDLSPYGTFAEIGGGQEVARWFFLVGGAASTVAKTISAYDMDVSDAVYGPAQQYVSRQRLEAMLDHEFGQLLERLGANRGDTTNFFAFADTVTTRPSLRPQPGHGWVEIRFAVSPHVADRNSPSRADSQLQ